VRVERAYFVLPLATTLECIELTSEDIEEAHGKHVANVRGEIIPYIRLREYFDMKEKRPEREPNQWLRKPNRDAMASSFDQSSEITRP